MIADGASGVIALGDLSCVGEARRAAVALAAACGLDENVRGRVAIVATEAATNVVRHGRGGSLLMRRLDEETRPGIELLAIDAGPGMENLDSCMRDGFSTGGTAGLGLGAISRQSDEFQLWTQPGRGVVLSARMREPGAPVPTLETGAVNVPLEGQPVSGDAFAVRRDGEAATALLVDGLGHGPQAHEAAATARSRFLEGPSLAPGDLLRELHGTLARTRGAAVAACAVDGGGALRFAGVGNISATVVSGAARRGLASQNGIVGHQCGRVHEQAARLPDGDVLVLHSDGVTNRWDLDSYAGLAGRHPALIAGVLWRDHRRARDDASVLALRRRR